MEDIINVNLLDVTREFFFGFLIAAYPPPLSEYAFDLSCCNFPSNERIFQSYWGEIWSNCGHVCPSAPLPSDDFHPFWISYLSRIISKRIPEWMEHDAFCSNLQLLQLISISPPLCLIIVIWLHAQLYRDYFNAPLDWCPHLPHPLCIGAMPDRTFIQS